MNKICVYAIAKNEAKFAAKWYENVKCADYVVCLDTGSTDGTPDILRSLGCTVYCKTYDFFRFDQARNDALDLALGLTDADVFVVPDLDELFDDGWCDTLRSAWDPATHTRGVFDYKLGEDYVAGTLNWIHDRSWRWRYPCHECMERADGTGIFYGPGEQLDLRGGKLRLHHWPDRSKPRAQYLPLLKLRVDENPDDQSSMAYYLRELMYAGSPDDAIAFEPRLPFPRLEGNSGAWACLCLANAYESKGNRARAKVLLHQAWLLDPANRTAPAKLAQLLCTEGDPLGAEAVLRRSLALSGTTRPDCLFLDHEDVWLWRMVDWLGVALFAQERYREALLHFETALAGANTDDARTHVEENIRICKSRLKTP